jgi:hypothetical protein
VGKIADGTSAARGFQALRQRYVRRAEYLAGLPDFRDTLKTTRQQWNEDYPEYRIFYEPDGPVGRELPAPLEAAGELLREDRLQEIRQIGSRFRSEERIVDAFFNWNWTTVEQNHIWFPNLDFPNPYAGDRGNPGLRFIQASMFTDPRLIDCEVLFPEFTLTPQTVREPDVPAPYRLEALLAGASPTQPGFLYLPLYPGMTVSDLRAAERTIVRRVGEHFRHRTAEARIREYRSDGCGPTEIANLLGLTVSTVNRVLSESGDG